MQDDSTKQRINDRINRNTDLYLNEEPRILIEKLSIAEDKLDRLILDNKILENKLKDERALKESAEALLESRDNEIINLKKELNSMREEFLLNDRSKESLKSIADRKRKALREYKEKFDFNFQREMEVELSDVLEEDEIMQRRIREGLDEVGEPLPIDELDDEGIDTENSNK